MWGGSAHNVQSSTDSRYATALGLEPALPRGLPELSRLRMDRVYGLPIVAGFDPRIVDDLSGSESDFDDQLDLGHTQ